MVALTLQVVRWLAHFVLLWVAGDALRWLYQLADVIARLDTLLTLKASFVCLPRRRAKARPREEPERSEHRNSR